MESVKFTCPNCGTEFEINEVANNKKSVRQTKAEARIAAMKAAGINVDNLFAIKGANDTDGMVGRLVDGHVEIVSDDDPVFAAFAARIKKNGVIPDRSLFRRWIMSQMFHAELYRDGIVGWLRSKGYEYSLKMLERELHAQSKMYDNNDRENLRARRRWFDRDVVVAVMDKDVREIADHIRNLKKKYCRGKEYKRICGRDYFVTDLEARVFKPLRDIITDMQRTSSYDCRRLENIYHRYLKVRKDLIGKLPMGADMSRDFIDAYKGSGAYFTLKNMLLFHGCKLVDEHSRNTYYGEAAVRYIDSLLSSRQRGMLGYEMLGMLRQCINDNNIDIKAEIESWRKRK